MHILNSQQQLSYIHSAGAYASFHAVRNARNCSLHMQHILCTAFFMSLRFLYISVLFAIKVYQKWLDHAFIAINTDPEIRSL